MNKYHLSNQHTWPLWNYETYRHTYLRTYSMQYAYTTRWEIALYDTWKTNSVWEIGSCALFVNGFAFYFFRNDACATLQLLFNSLHSFFAFVLDSDRLNCIRFARFFRSPSVDWDVRSLSFVGTISQEWSSSVWDWSRKVVRLFGVFEALYDKLSIDCFVGWFK